MKNFEKARLFNIIKQIDQLFSSRRPRGGRKPLIDATWFRSQIRCSPKVMTQAKKALGVKSKQVAGRHVWQFPTRTLEDALASTGRTGRGFVTRAKPDLTPVYANFLQDYFTGNNYQLTADEMAREFRGNGLHLRKFQCAARREIEARRFMKDGHWYWVWGGPAVQQWLEDLLSKGKMNQEDVYAAGAAKGWSTQVVWDARQKLGGIKNKKIGGITYWYDMNVSHEFDAAPTSPQELRGAAELIG